MRNREATIEVTRWIVEDDVMREIASRRNVLTLRDHEYANMCENSCSLHGPEAPLSDSDRISTWLSRWRIDSVEDFFQVRAKEDGVLEYEGSAEEVARWLVDVGAAV